MNVIIAPVHTDEELDAVLAIEQACFTSPWTREMYLTELDGRGLAHCFLARDAEGAPVGFCSFWRVLDELHINNLAVAPERRQQGIGSALLMQVLHDGVTSGATRATLEVRRSNQVALAMYGNFGFLVAGVRRAYYSHPVEDALILWKEHLAEG